MAEQLQAHRPLVRMAQQEVFHGAQVFRRAEEALGAHHFADCKSAALPVAEQAERKIRNARHGRKPCAVGQGQGADAHHGSVSISLSEAIFHRPFSRTSVAR